MSCVDARDCNGCMIKMAKYLLLICVLGLNVGDSAEMPPRVASCRQFYKAKPPEGASSSWTYVYTFRVGESCTESVTLQMSDSAVVNVTDPRNCQNYYRCTGLSCSQCPCDEDETFNPVTLRCDYTRAACQCDEDEPTVPTTIITEISISQISPEQSTPKEIIITPALDQTDTEQNPTDDSTNGIVIIAVIVVLTVIILLALVTGFCLWQRGIFPLQKEPNMHPSNNDGYLHTLPPQERHVYAEIDERTVGHNTQNTRLNEAASHQLQHIYAPPLPAHTANTTCVHQHPHETFVLPVTQQLRPYPQFSAYPMQSQATISQNRDLIRFSAASPESKANFSQNNNQLSNGCCPDCITDNSSVTSCSGCSNCSALSNHIPLENEETVDRRTLLHYSQTVPHHPQFHVISKQVYI